MTETQRNVLVLGIALSLLLAPSLLLAKEKRGAWLKIEKMDGFLVEGELLKVSGETLVLFDKNGRQGALVRQSEVRNLHVRRKRSALSGMAIGLGASLAASRLVSEITVGYDRSEAEMGFFMLTVFSAPVAMLVGGLASGLRKPFREMIVCGFQDEDRDAILAELRSLSREGPSEAFGE